MDEVVNDDYLTINFVFFISYKLHTISNYVTEGTMIQSFPTILRAKSFKFCLRKLKKVTQRIELLH